MHMSHITQFTIKNKNMRIFVLNITYCGIWERAIWDLWDYSIVTEHNQRYQYYGITGDNHGLIYIHIYPPGDKGLMYKLVY